jgi:hypothetical protein
MSVKMMNNVFERSLTTGNARLVLLALADTCSDEGVCFPSLKTLAKKANISEETTRKFLHAFEKIGLVKSEKRFNPQGRRTSNTYKLNVEKIGDDNLTKSVVYSVVHHSRHRSKDGFVPRGKAEGDGMNQSIPQTYEPVHTYHPMNQSIPSYMNHHKEPPVEPSSDSAIAPSESGGECTQDLLLPDDVAGSPAAPSPRKRKPKKVDDQFIAKLKTLNPTIDIDAELRKIDTWLLGHPERRKTRPFVANWINREAAGQAAKNNKDNTPRLPNGEIDWANVKPNE